MTPSSAALTPSHWTLDECERLLLDNLLIDEVTRGLGSAEAEELQLLLRSAREAEGADEAFTGEASTSDPLLEELHHVAAVTELCLIERHRREGPTSDQTFQIPAAVEADLRALARDEAKRLAVGNVLPFEQAAVYRPGLSPAWWVAAAATFLAVLAWWPRSDRATQVAESPNPDPIATQTAAAPALDERGDTIALAFTATEDESAAGASGRMLWNPTLQRGEMRIDGLAVNDPGTFQYQLWIFDAQRDERYPVDGGVFDIDGSSVVVAVAPPVPVSEATLFAITVEPPGGVVVSSRERIALVASSEAAA